MKKLLLLCFPCIVLLSGCLDMPDDVIMPSWDVDLNIPITTKEYTMGEIIKEQNYISVDPSQDNIFIIESDTYEQGKTLVDFIKVDNAISSEIVTVPSVNGSIPLYIDFRSDDVDIDSALFYDGNVSFMAKNNADYATTITFTTPGIVKTDGNPLAVEINLAPGEQRMVTSDLDDMKYYIPADQLFKDKFWVVAKTQSSGVFSSGQTVDFGVTIDDFKFDQIAGKFPTTELGKQTTNIDLDLGSDFGDFSGKIKLSEAELKLVSDYNSAYANSFTLNIDSLNIVGIRGNTKIFLTDSTGSRFIKIAVDNGTKTTVFNKNNSNIEEFLSLIPENIELTASYKIEGDNQFGMITSSDSVNFTTSFSTKSYISMRKSSIVDTTSIDLSDDDRKSIADGRSADINLDIQSAIPFNSSLKITLTDRNYAPLFVLTQSDDGTDSIAFASGQIDPATGKVVNPVLTNRTVKLTAAQIQLFSQAHYAIVSTSIMTTDADKADAPSVAVRSTDWVKIKAYGGIKYRVKPEDN